MPTLSDLQTRYPKQTNIQGRLGTDEVLVEDCRGQMSPGYFVEQKLRAALTTRVHPSVYAPRRPR
jgi:hypothetical protein